MTMQRTVKLDKLPEVISSFLFHKPFKGSKPCQSLSQTKLNQSLINLVTDYLILLAVPKIKWIQKIWKAWYKTSVQNFESIPSKIWHGTGIHKWRSLTLVHNPNWCCK